MWYKYIRTYRKFIIILLKSYNSNEYIKYKMHILNAKSRKVLTVNI